MLEGIREHDIIAGAYTHRDGICPMLAAHRHGGRTSAVSFARAWDQLAFRDGRSGARRATDREMLILRTHLEASLLEDEVPVSDLTAAIREHDDLRARPRLEPATPDTQAPRPGDPDRSRALAEAPGWRWTRVVRRLDDYERALARLQQSEHDRDLAGV